MKKQLLTLVFLISTEAIFGQQLSLLDLETAFLRNNLQLIAQKYQIGQAEALIRQERLWPNPSLTVDNVNLWANSTFETMEPLFGSFGAKQQFGAELEQLIETAGKRKKRVVLRELESKANQLEFDALLRELKLDLRSTYYSLLRIKQEEHQLLRVLQLFERLHAQYKVQAEKQHISQVNYYRVHTELIGIQREVLDLTAERLEKMKHLRVLTALPALTIADLQLDNMELPALSASSEELESWSLEAHPKLMQLRNEIDLAQQQVRVEVANRIPDLSMVMNYERGGNVMRNFVGIGVKLDIPVFNRNQGNITAARLHLTEQDQRLRAEEHEVTQALSLHMRELERYGTQLQEWKGQEDGRQVQVLENYSKYLQEQQVTLLEFIDFSQAYLEAQKAYLDLQEKYLNAFETLQYIIGKDLK